MTALETLIAARDWLAVGPERWCDNPHIMDVVRAVRGKRRLAMNAWSHLVHALYKATGNIGVLRWNDSLPPGRAGWERVIEAFNRAIEAEEARAHG